MTLDLLNNYAISLVIIKSPASFIATFVGVMVFISGLIVTVVSISAHSKASTVKDSSGTHVAIKTGMLSLMLAILAITQTGFVKNISIQNSRLEELCQTAELKVYKPNASDINSIYVDRDHTVQFEGGYGSFGSLGGPFLHYLNFYETKNPEYTADNKLKYLRVSLDNEKGWGDKKEEVNEIQSVFSVLNTEISSEQDKYIGIFGSDVRVINNKNNEELAHFRYFWNKNNHRKFCPAINNRLLPTQTIMYVLGIDMQEEVKRRVMEGLAQ